MREASRLQKGPWGKAAATWVGLGSNPIGVHSEGDLAGVCERPGRGHPVRACGASGITDDSIIGPDPSLRGGEGG